MKKKNWICRVFVGLTLVLSVFLVSCRFDEVKLEKKESVFVKNLIYTEEMDLTIPFITSEDWENLVVEVAIPELGEDVSCDIYGESEEQIGSYLLHRVEFGLGFRQIREDGRIPEDVTFHKIEVTWEDGSKTIEDIGTVTIMGGTVPDELDLDPNMSEMREAITIDNDAYDEITRGYFVHRDKKLAGVWLPYEEVVMQLVPEIRLNGISLKNGMLPKEKRNKVEKGDTLELFYRKATLEFLQQKGMDYGNIDIRGRFLEQKEDGSVIKGTPFRLYYDSIDADPSDGGAYVSDYLKQLGAGQSETSGNP